MAEDFLTESWTASSYEEQFKAQRSFTRTQVAALAAFTFIEVKFEDGPNRSLLLLEKLKHNDVVLLVADVNHPEEPIWVEPHQIVGSYGKIQAPSGSASEKPKGPVVKVLPSGKSNGSRRPRLDDFHKFVRSSIEAYGLFVAKSPARGDRSVIYYLNLKQRTSGSWNLEMRQQVADELFARIAAVFTGVDEVILSRCVDWEFPSSVIVRLHGDTVEPI